MELVLDLEMAHFQKYIAQQTEKYNRYHEAFQAAVDSAVKKKRGCSIIIEMYDDGNPLQKIALQDLICELSADTSKVFVLSHYTDMPDDNGPYGFIRSYHTITIKKRCCHDS